MAYGVSEPDAKDGFRYWSWGDPGLIGGAIICLAVGTVFWTILRLGGHNLTALIVGATIAVAYFSVGLHTVQVAYRGVYLVFGRRVRVGKDKMGFNEGLVWSPIPLFGPVEIRDENTKHRFIPDQKDPDTAVYGSSSFEGMDIADFAKASEGSEGKVPVHLFLLIQFWVTDPYRFQTQEDPILGLVGLFQRATRHFISLHTPEELVDMDKQEMSDKIKEIVENELAKEGEETSLIRWGLQLGIVRVTNIKVDEDLVKAWKQTSVEKYERLAEAVEAEAQNEQIKKLVDTGVSPNTAAALRAVSQGKDGAKLEQKNIEFSVSDNALETAGEVSKGVRALDRLARRILGDNQ